MEHNRTFWVGAVAIIVIGALLFWWASSGLPLSTWTGFGKRATTTLATSTDSNASGSGSQAGSGGSTNTSKQDVATIVAGLSGASQFKSWFTSTGVAATINP
jgi:hypothetical protein